MEDTGRSIADELKKLHELFESGVISKEDFERAKNKMIMGVSAPVNELDSGRSQPSEVKVLDETSPEVSEAQKVEQIGRAVGGLIALVILVIGLGQVFDISMPGGIGRSNVVGTYECSRSTMTRHF